MALAETIFALSSGKGRSGIAIVRLSGPDANRVLANLMLCKTQDLPQDRRAKLTPLYSGRQTEKLDNAIVLRFLKPKSFTGEDVVELHLHGGPAVISAVLDTLGNFAFVRPAEPGEFTKRAFENGFLDLTEVEGLADLINAETEMQRRQALRQMDGALGTLYETWRKTILTALAYLEATIDFAEAELSEGELKKAVFPAFNLIDEIKAHLADKHRGELLRDGIRVAIIGGPNTGKSSLLNVLAKREISITSETAGTTRDLIETQLDIGGYSIIFSDTAGIRESSEAIEREGVRRAIISASDADLRIIVIDVGNPSPWLTIREFVKKDDIIVINKCDIAAQKPIEKLPKNTIVRISAKKNQGIDTLIEALLEWTERAAGDLAGEAPTLTRARHRKELEICMGHLENAKKGWTEGAEHELVAEDSRLASRALGRITGLTDVEDLLGVIFNDFCIGK